MSNPPLLDIDPLELKFLFELKKQISSSLYLKNKSLNHVAYKVKTTNPKKYCVRPNTGVVSPNSTCSVLVTMQAQNEAPPEMQCKDKFLLQSVVVNPDQTPSDINPEMFNKSEGHFVEECKLRVVYVSPLRSPSPTREESEEGYSSGTSMLENRKLSGSAELPSVTINDLRDKSVEEKDLVAKLIQEKTKAIEQSNKLRQELELLRHDKTGGGTSFIFVIIVGLIGIFLGYIIKKA